MKDIEIFKKWGIPLQTLQGWKKTKDGNWRKKIYEFLKSLDD